MSARDIITRLFCDCASADTADGDTKVTVLFKGTKCCNRKKITLNVTNTSASKLEQILRQIVANTPPGTPVDVATFEL